VVRERVLDFLESRLARERRLHDPQSLDALSRSLAFLGAVGQLPRLRAILAEDFDGRHPGIKDSIEFLEENSDGRPVVSSIPPWVERYGWLFEDDRDRARRAERREPELPAAPEAEGESEEKEDDSDLSILYWGLHGVAPSDEEDDELDARRFLDRPPAD
jgi:hypothetical protein